MDKRDAEDVVPYKTVYAPTAVGRVKNHRNLVGEGLAPPVYPNNSKNAPHLDVGRKQFQQNKFESKFLKRGFGGETSRKKFLPRRSPASPRVLFPCFPA